MREFYLEVTFRRGKALAAYYYLQRRPGQKSFKTRRVEPGMVIDFNRGGEPIGIEITAPGKITLTAFNGVLRELGLPPLKRSDLKPALEPTAAPLLRCQAARPTLRVSRRRGSPKGDCD